MNRLLESMPGRRVLVWGIGRHGGGVAAARFCAARGAQVEMLDQRPPQELGEFGNEVLRAAWPWHVGDATHPAFSHADLIVASPAIPPRAWPTSHPERASPEALFFAAHRGPRLAVTGTKGKSTTAMLAGLLLGWEVGGNSNEPLLNLLARIGPDAPVVCELSSFQLWYLGDHPPRIEAAILTSLARDHLDWHADLAHYHAAKLALFAWADAWAAPADLAARLPHPERAARPMLFEHPAFRCGSRALARRDDLPLIGAHNVANACLAMTAAQHLGAAPDRFAERLRTARPLPHRLVPVHLADGLRFVDDSIATTPESAMAALAAIDGPLAIILGGSDKGADFVELARAVANRGALPVVIGSTAPRILSALASAGVVAPRAADIDQALTTAAEAIAGKGTVLLSPACASFDMFNGFEDRGDRFAQSARRLFPSPR